VEFCRVVPRSRICDIAFGRIAPSAVCRQDSRRLRFVEPRMSNPNRRTDNGDAETGIATKTRPKTKRPSLYRVMLLNDDYTPMEFVVLVLERFFQKGRDEATYVMLHVHQNGAGECGIYTYEVAETKVTQVMDFARKHQHPLQCVMEKK
jgi:ATP-dependent Clp protease adaptor protein ClpS